jgi:uncharacterized protein (TIGR03083 family)
VNFEQYIAALRSEGALFAEALDLGWFDDAVPTCPGWTVRELTRHTGGIHRWAATYVGEARREVVQEDLEEISGGWPPDDALVEWFVDGHAALVDTLVAAPKDLDCLAFLPAPSPRLMWARRQAHETAIHRADAEAARGEISPCPPDFAADGIDELLTGYLGRPGKGPRRDPPYRLRVQADDLGVAWSMSIRPDSFEVERDRRSPDVTVSGSASALYLFLWNRLEASELEVEGDASLLTHWRENTAVRWG